MQYEKRVQKALKKLDVGNVICNQWIEYWDRNGPGAAETDAYIVFPSRVILMDMKLTAKFEHWPQLEELYSPLLGMIYNRPVHVAQVGRSIRPGLEAPIFPDLISFLRADVPRGVIHWTI